MTETEFADIIKSTKNIVLSAIQNHLPERFYHAIDDVVQETYIRAYNSLTKNKFREDSSISTWLYVIAKNESFRMNKKLAQEESKFNKSVDKIRFNNLNIENKLNDDILDLYSKIEILPEKYRHVIELVAVGMSEKQIADKLEIKTGTVKSRASRARGMLQKLLLGEDK